MAYFFCIIGHQLYYSIAVVENHIAAHFNSVEVLVWVVFICALEFWKTLRLGPNSIDNQMLSSLSHLRTRAHACVVFGNATTKTMKRG